MANGRDNLIKNEDLTPEERRESARRAGIASGIARRRKKTIKAGIRAMMEEGAPEKVRNAFGNNGYDVDTNYDAVVASIIMGAIKGNPKMIDKVLEMVGEDPRVKAREAEVRIAKKRLEIEQKKAELEAEKQKAWIEAVKAQETAQMEDDGFLDALMGTAADDWSDNDAD